MLVNTEQLLAYQKKETAYAGARAWKASGKKVIGVIDSLVPEELICAAGMLPVRLRGADSMNTPLARKHRVPQSNLFLNSVLEAGMQGEFDFCDGMVCTNRDADFLRFSDVFAQTTGIPVFVLDVPLVRSDASTLRLAKELKELAETLGEISGCPVSEESLKETIREYNTGRDLLQKIQKLNQQEVPVLTGAEQLGISLAAMSMPREEFNLTAQAAYEELKERNTEKTDALPRLIVSTDLLDHTEYLELAESCGCHVVLVDSDTSYRYFGSFADEAEDPYTALASRCLKIGLPRFLTWEEQFAEILTLAKEYSADGILEMMMHYDEPRAYRSTAFRKKMQGAGYSFISFERDYQFTAEGQLKTRIGAFLEMIQAK